METREKVRIALTIASFAAISIFVTVQYRKLRKRRQQSENDSCYLKTESKPQGRFKRVLADNSYAPFKHLKLSGGDAAATSATSNVNSSEEHPYRAAIEELLKNPVVEFDFLDTGNVDMELRDSHVWIETESQLQELVTALSEEKVFGVDTEQHSLRSFLGFTALIQISTRTKDYLVDTIALHDEMALLRPVFASPAICKVFHGADNDILWLQRDFHIYIVNMFDTAKACEVLSKPQKSLAYLLQTYCGVATNKQLQREDWRQRPLPLEMVQYARVDAHYLLHIAHCLASELVQQISENSACPDDKFHFLLETSRRSNANCLQLFYKEVEASPGEAAASSIISRNLNDHGSLSPRFCDAQFQDIVRRLCAWRDLMARVHDESLRYVLSDQAIVALAHNVPVSEIEVYETINQADLNVDSQNLNLPLQSPSSVICSHVEDFDYIFQDDIGDLETLFQLILQKHLGPKGSCPLSVHNYALLSRTNLKLVSKLVSKQNRHKNAKKIGKRASRALFVQKFSCKSPVYHNCRIYANDGRLLCYCDRRKLEWYLRRDLAKLVEEDPQGIMLLFEPKGRPEDEGNEFYIQSKKNICVGCGEGNHYLRYRVIPSCYRMHFPEHLKSHRSHDIVLVCVDCHELAHAAAEKHKRKIAAEYGIPLFVRRVVDSTQNGTDLSASLEEAGVSPLELRTAAMALLRHGPRMPPKRREELIQVVMKYYGGREISDEDLERALLVGMSPHEKRRLEKKRQSAAKKAAAKSITPNDISGTSSLAAEKACGVEEMNASATEVIDEIPPPATTNTPDLCDMSGSLPKMEQASGVENSSVMATEGTIGNSDASSSLDSDTNAVDIVAVDSEDRASSEPNYKVNQRSQSGAEETMPPKHNSKLSLLGHGPHGQQVVDHILREYGEAGISNFCQRWRQVFVEAIHPRFLPAGWDVMHSGRRDFGDFSVYNPSKKTAVGAAVVDSK